MKDRIERIDKEFGDLIKEVQQAKIKNGTAKLGDRRTFSTRRITKAMRRHPDMERVIRDIVNTKLEGE